MLELHFEINSQCPLACKHCSSSPARHCARGYRDADISRFLRELPQPAQVYFTGGEPLLYEGLTALLSESAAQSPCCSFGLFTTGLTSREPDRCVPVERAACRELYEAGLRRCYVSLYDHQASGHDFMTNCPGSFDATTEAMKRLSQAGIDVRVNLVVTKQNQDRLEAVWDYAGSLGCSELRLLKIVRHGSAAGCWEEIGLSEQRYGELVRALLQREARGGLPRLTVSGVPEIAPCRPLPDAAGCQAGRSLYYVALSGQVYPCACVKNDPARALFHISRPWDRETLCARREAPDRGDTCLARGMKT